MTNPDHTATREWKISNTDKQDADVYWDTEPQTNHEVIVKELPLAEVDAAILVEALQEYTANRHAAGKPTGYDSLSFRASMLIEEIWVWRAQHLPNHPNAIVGAPHDVIDPLVQPNQQWNRD